MSFSKHQQWLIKKIKSLGYPSNDWGICHGISMTAIPLFLDEQGELFDNLIKYLHDTPISEIKNDLEKIKEKKISFQESAKNKAKTEVDMLSDKNPMSEAEKKEEIKKRIQKSEESFFNTLQEEEKVHLELLPILDSIELHQKASRAYLHLFSPSNKPKNQKDSHPSHSLTISENMEKNGGLKKFDVFSGVYNFADMKTFFESLNNTLTPETSKFALEFSNKLHSITVIYNQKSWVLIDAENFPSQYFQIENTSELAKKLLENFKQFTHCFSFRSQMSNVNEEIEEDELPFSLVKTKEEDWKLFYNDTKTKSRKEIDIDAVSGLSEILKTCPMRLSKPAVDLVKEKLNSYLIENNIVAQMLSTTPYSIDAHSKTCSECLNQWRNDGNFLSILEPNTSKSNEKDPKGSYWLEFAQSANELELLQKILAQMIIRPREALLSIGRAYGAAIKSNQLEMIKIFSEDAKNPNVFLYINEFETATPLMIAAQGGMIDVVHFFLKHPDIDPNQKNEEGRTALDLAAAEGHNEVVELLKKYQTGNSIKNN